MKQEHRQYDIILGEKNTLIGESSHLAKSSSASHSKNKGGDSGDGEHEGKLTS